MCEESHPPTWYFPREDVRMDLLEAVGGSTACEFKGAARYFHVRSEPGGAPVCKQAGWTYERASGRNEPIRGHLAFYLREPLVATVDGERARPQEGDFYGGWITADVVGPFKGGPGTRFW